MDKPKFFINDIVYIAFWDNIIECIVKEIHITDSNINYKLQKSIDVYLRNEDEVFKTYDETKKFIQKRNLIAKINDVESEASNYREWVSSLDVAIRNYEACKTDICIKKQSNQTNGNDETLFNVRNTGSKKLLEYLRKYFNDVLKELENEIEELKKDKGV